MSTPYLSELRVFSFNFPPKGWAACNGQVLPINSNQALFALLGTTYGGNGTTTFALPDLQGRVAIGGVDGAESLGTRGGAASVTLSGAQLPAHTHPAFGSTSATTNSPNATVLPGTFATDFAYSPSATSLSAMGPAAVTSAGGGQAHANYQPSLALNVCIALVGIFPSRN